MAVVTVAQGRATELALDHVQRHPLTGHLDGMCVA